MLQVVIWLNVPRFESSVQITKLQDLVNRSKLARCRGRFVCPVILYNGKVKASDITSCFRGIRHSKVAFGRVVLGLGHCLDLDLDVGPVLYLY